VPYRPGKVLPVTVHLKVPIVQAVQWDPWLTDNLGQAAERAGVEYDGGEEEGTFEVFAFDGTTAEQVRDIASEVLASSGEKATVTVTGDHEVTVVLAPSDWLVPLMSGQEPYPRAIRKLGRETAAKPEFAAWWSGTTYPTLLFHQAHDAHGRNTWSFTDTDDDPPQLIVTAQLDLSILNIDKPARGEAARVAKENLGTVLATVSKHLGLEPPPRL
jgi:hypothetical protein